MKTFSTLAALAGTALLPVSATGQVSENPGAADYIEVGMLTCNVEGGVGFVVGSTREMSCEFSGVDGAPNDLYVGEVNRVGLDIGVTGPSTIVWAVLAPSRDIPVGALGGTYGGVGAQATAGVGLGANIMIGGSQNSFALQPVSVEASTGVNIAAGIAEMELTAAVRQ